MGYRRVLTGIILLYALQQRSYQPSSKHVNRKCSIIIIVQDKFRQNDDNQNTLYAARFRCR
jgi:hypothetical protein